MGEGKIKQTEEPSPYHESGSFGVRVAAVDEESGAPLWDQTTDGLLKGFFEAEEIQNTS